MSDQMAQHIQLIDRAATLALDNVTKYNGGPFGALIARDGIILSTGTNLVTSHHDPTAHAEIVAIRSAAKSLRSFDLSGCIIYTSCEPCPMCLSAIYWARLDAVYYAQTREDADQIGFSDKAIYEQINLAINLRSLSMHQIINDKAALAMSSWEFKEDKQRY